MSNCSVCGSEIFEGSDLCHNCKEKETPKAENNSNTAPKADVMDGKTIAILSYCTFVGWIIGIIMHGNNKTEIGAYHLRQALGLYIFGMGLFLAVFILGLIITFIAPFIGIFFYFTNMILWFGMIGLMVWGLIIAINNEMKPIPFIGEMSQKMFAGIK
ncbi:MAG: hypothetical protein HXX09_09695 [Bacteroidetes bacterium]|nr:hypothetical protein [Bacteroidota bacterium]